MKKAALIQKIVASLEAELELYAQSARAAHEEATHEQSKAENKYDTRGLEASYLAHGQSLHAMETLKARKDFLTLEPRDFGPADVIDLGALVELEGDAAPALYFIGPQAGGLEIVQGKKTIMVITPQSPLGSQLLGHKEGDKLTFDIRGSRRHYRITRVA